MADTIYTRALAQAVEMHGSTQALASELRVPENTLQRWISGRAQMPLQAFRRTVELLVGHERRVAPPSSPAPFVEPAGFTFEGVSARCAKCGGTEFLAAATGAALRMTSELECKSCKARVTHGELVTALATLAVTQARKPHKRPAPARGPEQRPGARPPDAE